jgi:hypothetical protein
MEQDLELETFTLSIRMGNAAMLTPEDVGEALRQVADKLDNDYTDGPVIDVNGNRVGSWALR